MKELAIFLLTSLAEKPGEITVYEEKQDNILKLKVKVAQSDRGKIIGKEGKIIRAVRTVLSAVGLKQNIKVFLEVE
jgi:predicted RNA-binding protein YlqC (UPF0109 family)